MKPNYYYTIHKAIRRKLFDFAVRLGQSDAECLHYLNSEFHALFELLHEHAGHEDLHFQPLIERHLPSDAQLLAHEHAEHDRLVSRLQENWSNLLAQPNRTASVEFYAEFNSFVGYALRHLAFEEDVMIRLWERCDAEELSGPLRAMLATFSPETSVKNLAYILPALCPEERREFVGSLKRALPEHFREKLVIAAGEEVVVQAPAEKFQSIQMNWTGARDVNGRKIPGDTIECVGRGVFNPSVPADYYRDPVSLFSFTVLPNARSNIIRFKTIRVLGVVTQGRGLLRVHDSVDGNVVAEYRLSPEFTFNIPATTRYSLASEGNESFTGLLVSSPAWFQEDEEYEWDLVRFVAPHAA